MNIKCPQCGLEFPLIEPYQEESKRCPCGEMMEAVPVQVDPVMEVRV